MRKYVLTVVSALCLVSCTSIGGPGVSSYFDCGDGTMLKVTYSNGGATVQKDNGLPAFLRSVPSTGASAFENRAGHRLSVSGETATWSERTREAPLSCRRVAVPR
jgi:hypothetical protein